MIKKWHVTWLGYDGWYLHDSYISQEEAKAVATVLQTKFPETRIEVEEWDPRESAMIYFPLG